MALNAITVADLSVGDLPSEEVMQDQGRRAALAARRIVRRPVIDVDVIAGIQCRTSADGRLDAGKVTFIKSLVTDMATALGVAGAGPHPDR